jgi:hypothetical protein
MNSQNAQLIDFVQNSSFIDTPSTVVYRKASLHPPVRPLTAAIKRGAVFNGSVSAAKVTCLVAFTGIKIT